MSAGDIRAEVTGTDSTHNVHFNWTGRSGTGYFTPSETGLHKVRDTTRDCNLSFSPLVIELISCHYIIQISDAGYMKGI